MDKERTRKKEGIESCYCPYLSHQYCWSAHCHLLSCVSTMFFEPICNLDQYNFRKSKTPRNLFWQMNFGNSFVVLWYRALTCYLLSCPCISATRWYIVGKKQYIGVFLETHILSQAKYHNFFYLSYVCPFSFSVVW